MTRLALATLTALPAAELQIAPTCRSRSMLKMLPVAAGHFKRCCGLDRRVPRYPLCWHRCVQDSCTRRRSTHRVHARNMHIISGLVAQEELLRAHMLALPGLVHLLAACPAHACTSDPHTCAHGHTGTGLQVLCLLTCLPDCSNSMPCICRRCCALWSRVHAATDTARMRGRCSSWALTCNWRWRTSCSLQPDAAQR
jgi:hypothetical protein